MTEPHVRLRPERGGTGRPDDNGQPPSDHRHDAQGRATGERTDLGNAEYFCRLHSADLRYVKEQRRWIGWSDSRWRTDTTGAAERATKETARELLRRAADADGAEQKAAVKWALASQSEARVRAMLSLASTEPAVVLAADQLDADPFLLACPNGTVDLRTGELRGADPADLITAGTDVVYEPDASCPTWLRFLDEVLSGDAELVASMQRFMGYTLTGDTKEDELRVYHGTGGNGKSTLVEVHQRLLGDLSRVAAFDSFVRTRGGRGPRDDLARLRGARMVVASESGEGRRLDEATVKQLTGGDVIAARFLYGEYFEFKPAFKLLLVTNHRPRVDGDDDAIWRRLRLVPFEQSFQGREDPNLPATLAEELPGILAWAVEGCLAWQRDGLGDSKAVQRATLEYRQDEDVVGSFLAERCETGGGAEVTTVALREAYEGYCRDLGEQPLRATTLGRQLARRGISRGGPQRRFYTGVKLR